MGTEDPFLHNLDVFACVDTSKEWHAPIKFRPMIFDKVIPLERRKKKISELL
jgi:hypothetical protein